MRVFETLELMNTGICLNALLLLLIARFSSPTIGGYKFLLAIFSTYGIYLCVLHALLNPVRINNNNNSIDCVRIRSISDQLRHPIRAARHSFPIAILDCEGTRRLSELRSPRIELFSKPYFIIGQMVSIMGIVVDNSEPGLQPVLAAFQVSWE
ncbi:hypothetical protein PRIPAC_77329, partial [Pristionchus pacificus]|uniref:G protein-coupled receptor n=1 Tax=Pristionchus pacificus TaxID=54126 RepID=A0A2A6CPL0_PRIPA